MSHASRLAFTLTLAAVAALVCSAATASLIDIKATDVFDGTTHFAPGTYLGTPAANHGISADGKTVNLLLGDQVIFTVYADLSALGPSGSNITNGMQTAYLSIATRDYDAAGAAASGVGADRFGVSDMTGANGTVYPLTSNVDAVIQYVSAAKDPGSPLDSMNPQTTETLAGGPVGWGTIGPLVGASLGLAGDEDIHLAQGGPVSGGPHPGAHMTSSALMSLTYTAGASATAGTGSRRTQLNVLGGTFADWKNQIASGLALLTPAGGVAGPEVGLTVNDIGLPVIVGVNVPPVPEPGTMALLLMGAVAVLFARRRLWG